MKKINETTFTSDNGLITFIHGDCMEFMAGCWENEFDLAVVDPPYGIERFQKGSLRFDKKGIAKNGIKWDVKPTQSFFDNLFIVSKNQIVFGANNFIMPPTEYFLIWNKQQTVDNFASAEYAWVSMGLKMPAKVFDYSIHKHNQTEKIHLTQKPIALYRWIFKNYAKPTDTIIDTHGGSMSSAIAAHMEGLRMTIVELDPDYFKAALNRFAIYESQLRLF